MLKRYNTVIADASCFILLDRIDHLFILKELFGNVITTFEVGIEFGKALPDWINIEIVTDGELQKSFELEVDKGEASAISLAIEKGNSLLILDDLKARKLASKLGLQFTGTLGILLKAKEVGIITAIKPILLNIQQTTFRFSKKIFEEILQMAGE